MSLECTSHENVHLKNKETEIQRGCGGQAAQQSEFQTGWGSLEPEPAHSRQIIRGGDKGLRFLVYANPLFLCKQSSESYLNHSFMYLVLMVWGVYMLHKINQTAINNYTVF